MAEPVIRAEGLARRFGRAVALKDFTFDVPEGAVFGLVGPNGAGKTTAIQILLGLTRPDHGSSAIFGQDSLRMDWRTRQRIGYLSEEPFPYDDLPIEDLLRFVASFFEEWDWDRSKRLLDATDLPRDRVLKAMSKGQRRRAELLLALASGPDLLVLDDPTAGLDATVRREFLRKALEVAREEGKTVLFTSHVLTDVERIVDTVGFLVDGTMRRVAPLDELKARTKRIVIETEDAAPKLPGELARARVPGGLAVTTDACTEALLADLGSRYPRVHAEDLSLEDIFVAVVAAKEEAPA